jgi:hypothetical protein
MASSGLASGAASPSLRELQRSALVRLLNLNVDVGDVASPAKDAVVPQTGPGEPVWKFLVFDKMGQDVISSVLRVSDLREAGVTVHMQLRADRLQMQDVPASMSLRFGLMQSLPRRTHRREHQFDRRGIFAISSCSYLVGLTSETL